MEDIATKVDFVDELSANEYNAVQDDVENFVTTALTVALSSADNLLDVIGAGRAVPFCSLCYDINK